MTIFAAARTPHTTSDRAGACFTPFRDEDDPRPFAWSREGHRALCEIASRHPESGVRLGVMREYMHTLSPPEPWWGEIVGGVRRLPGRGAYSTAFEATLPHMDMTRYVAWLERRACEAGVAVVDRRVECLEELFDEGFGIVVNCAGLGARELARDDAVTPMRGQVQHCRNTLGLADSLHDEPRGEVVTYIFAYPEHLVLGGTYEPGVGIAETEVGAIAAIVERCRALLLADGHPRWAELGRDEIKRVAGLRPARVIGNNPEAIRLERECTGAGVVVHNYGHGRSGVTLSWGCAAEVVTMVES